MRLNGQPLVPQAALERAQGEIDSLYVQIVDLHAEIAAKSERLHASTLIAEELRVEVEDKRGIIATMEQMQAESKKVSDARTKEIAFLREKLAEANKTVERQGTSIARLQQQGKAPRK